MRNRNSIQLGEDKVIGVRDFINIFLRRKQLFFLISIPIFIIMVLNQSTKPYNPIYRATFDIGVTKERPIEGFFTQYAEAPAIQVGMVTQRVISTLLSVDFAGKVLDSLGLYTSIAKDNSDLRIETKIKENFKKPFGPVKLRIFKGGFSLSSNSGLVKEGKLNEYGDLGFLEFKITAVNEIPEGKTYQVIFYPREMVAVSLRNSLSIKVLEADKIDDEIGYSGVPISGEEASKRIVSAPDMYYYGMNLLGILRINVYWGSPEDANRIAQVLADLIIKEDTREKSLQFIQSKSFIDSQLTFYQANLHDLEEKIRSFKQQTKIVDLAASTQALITQIAQFESRKSQLQVEQKILTGLQKFLIVKVEGIDTMPNFASVFVSDPVLQSFYAQLQQAEAQLRTRLKAYTPGHPKVLEKKAELDGLKDQMKEEIVKRIPAISAEISSVESQISMLQIKLQDVPDDEVQLARLERDRETAEKLYTFFAEKLEETRVQEAGVTADLKIVNRPMGAVGPVNAKGTFKGLMVALMMSILAGGFAVLVTEFLDNTVKDPDVVTSKTGLPIFASIPILEDARKAEKFDIMGKIEKVIGINLFRKQKAVAPFTILNGDVYSAEFEAFRKLSMNLDFAHPEKKYQVLYVVSPGPEEGKTFIAINLGISLGMAGKKVIIIDTDFRKKKGHLSDVTNLEKEEGLFDVLRGEIKLSDAIVNFEQSVKVALPVHEPQERNKRGQNLKPANNLVVNLLPIGRIPPNPFVFLESEKMKNLLDELRKSYDHIIIDGVPVLLFADATYLANNADGVLLTIKYAKTGIKELETARDILDSAKSNILGMVMNGVPKTRGSYYYQYYHKYYSKYYKRDSST